MKKKMQNRLAYWHKNVINPIIRLHCNQPTKEGHFIPPSFGHEGFWTCEKQKTQNNS